MKFRAARKAERKKRNGAIPRLGPIAESPPTTLESHEAQNHFISGRVCLLDTLQHSNPAFHQSPWTVNSSGLQLMLPLTKVRFISTRRSSSTADRPAKLLTTSTISPPSAFFPPLNQVTYVPRSQRTRPRKEKHGSTSRQTSNRKSSPG